MRKILLLIAGLIGLLFSAACSSQIQSPVTVEVTRLVKQTVVVTATALPETATVAPAAAPIRMNVPAECVARQENVPDGRYAWFHYDFGACRLFSLSPDGQQLAYVTPALWQDPQGLPNEAVRIYSNLTGKTQQAYVVKASKTWIHGLAWSNTGQLLFSMGGINAESDTLIYDPKLDQVTESIKGGLGKWNGPRTALYSILGYGEADCRSVLSGYDFSKNKAFPDLFTALDVPPGLQMMIKPVAWETDDRLLLEITLLQGDPAKFDYKLLPTIAGVIELTAEGPVYKTLSSKKTQDSLFSLLNDKYQVVLQPYKPSHCLDGLN